MDILRLALSRILVSVLFIIGAVGCSSLSQGEGGPYVGDGFTFSPPDGWKQEQRNSTAEGGRGSGTIFLSPEVPKNSLQLPSEVWLFQPQNPESSLDAYLDLHYGDQTPWSSNVTENSRERISVPGASHAIRLEGDGETGPPDHVTIRQWAVIAMSTRGVLLELWCRGAVEDFDAPSCNRVFDSFQLI